MIEKGEILKISRQIGLNPSIIEKDYVLGWLLAGISTHPALRDVWVFKGGTCLKKCFFPKYRFSEDLDFTVLDPVHLDSSWLKERMDAVTSWVSRACEHRDCFRTH